MLTHAYLAAIPTRPPMSSANCLDIARPKPVPRYCGRVGAHAWVNLAHSLSCSSAEIPIPVSLTTILMPSSSCSTRRLTAPPSVNFSAFGVKFETICRTRIRSP